ncbi:MAG: LysE family transporter [Thermoproteota archaeon]|jgi:Putative threonine efflux protein
MFDLIILTILISLSGALSPGPLTVSTAALGARKGYRAGIIAAFGHMIFEMPFVLILCILYANVYYILNNFYFNISFISFLEFFIVFFATSMIRDAIKGNNSTNAVKIQSPFMTGFIFTSLNPFFLIWWATVGFPIINLVISYQFPISFFVMYFSHVWLDYAWLTFVAGAAATSLKIFKDKGFKALNITLGIFLYYLAVSIILGRFFGIRII